RCERSAIWTSGEPVSPSVVPYSLMICCFVAVSKAIALLGRCAAHRTWCPGSGTSGPDGAPARRAGRRWGGYALRGRCDGSGRISAGDVGPGALRIESAAGHLDVVVHLRDQRLGGVGTERGALEVNGLPAHQIHVGVSGGVWG